MGFFKKIKKQFKRSVKKIKKEIKRVPGNLAEYPIITQAATLALSAIPGAGPIIAPIFGAATSVLLPGEAGETGVLYVDPVYAPGGTPLGQGNLGKPAPGQEFSGRPPVTVVRLDEPTQKQNPLANWEGGIWIGVGVLALLFMSGK